MTQHNQTHQMLLHSTYRDPTWGTTENQDACAKCHHPHRQHTTQTCPACRQQTVHKCPPGYIDESDTRARYHNYYCEKCILETSETHLTRCQLNTMPQVPTCMEQPCLLCLQHLQNADPSVPTLPDLCGSYRMGNSKSSTNANPLHLHRLCHD